MSPRRGDSRVAPDRPVRVLWVATKSPWPPDDGGRLLMARTLETLDPSRVRVTLVVPSRIRGAEPGAEAVAEVLSTDAEVGRVARVAVLARSVLGGQPWTARRHRHGRLRELVEERLARRTVDVVHAEQPHALANVPDTDVPLLLRAQNVEGDLWARYAESRRGPLGSVLRRQAEAVRRWELLEARRADVVAAVSVEDRDRFVELGVEDRRVVHLPPPFPERLDTAAGSLAGDPPLVLVSGSGWRPNRLGERRFLDRSWPAIAEALPDARLHLFGAESPGRRPGVVIHERPRQAADLFPEGAVLLVPVEATSGIRMKILEAWARGVAVISTPAGLRGLDAQAAAAVPTADSTEQWVQAVRHLRGQDEQRRQVELGRRILDRLHAPHRVAHRLVALYRSLAGLRGGG